jgi:hypothetical protein
MIKATSVLYNLDSFSSRSSSEQAEADETYYPETPRNKTPSTASGKNTNATSAEHGDAAANGTTGLYNPILPGGPGENGATDYTSSARRASGISANSRTGEQKSPTLRNVPESEKASGSAAMQKNGVTPEGAFLFSLSFVQSAAVLRALWQASCNRC